MISEGNPFERIWQESLLPVHLFSAVC